METACARLLRVAHWFAALDGLAAKHGHLPFFILVAPRIQVCTCVCLWECVPLLFLVCGAACGTAVGVQRSQIGG